MKKMRKKILLALTVIFFVAQASAATGNFTEVEEQLQDAEQEIRQMEKAGIPTERVESLLTTANRSFRAQKSLAEQGGNPDFSRVSELTDQISSIQETALRVNDRLNALEGRIENLENSSLNLSGVKKAYTEVNTTFHNQRFEEAENQVEDVYSEISEARSVQTQVQAFASAQRKNIVGAYNAAVEHARENWKRLLFASAIFIVFLIAFIREYHLWTLELRREKLIDKKHVIEDMIEEAQHEYYVKGKGSEISFNTRMEKFQEMKRDTEQHINSIESRLKSMKGLPVISPEIKEKSEEFQAEGEVMEEAGEVKGSLERISERREEEPEGEEKQEEGTEETTEEKSEEMKEYEEIVSNDTVGEAKDEIEKLEDPDYEALLRAEKEGKDRKTLKEYLKEQIRLE